MAAKWAKDGRGGSAAWPRMSPWWRDSPAARDDPPTRSEQRSEASNTGTASGSSGGSLSEAFGAFEKATSPSEWAMQRAFTVLDHPRAIRKEIEVVLIKIFSWLSEDTPGGNSKALAAFHSAGLHHASVRLMRKYCEEPPVVGLIYQVLQRAAHGNAETAAACVRAGALEEIVSLMDRHQSHGGIQNVCLRLLCDLIQEGGSARQAVSLGAMSRVLRALETTAGREVQYNGCAAVRLLADSGRAPRSGLQEALMRAKADHENDASLCNLANEVLALVTPRFKEVQCWHWQSGWCRLGARCTYAHGQEDLRGS